MEQILELQDNGVLSDACPHFSAVANLATGNSRSVRNRAMRPGLEILPGSTVYPHQEILLKSYQQSPNKAWLSFINQFIGCALCTLGPMSMQLGLL